MIDVVMITTGERSELLKQALNTIHGNAASYKDLSLTMVCDGYLNGHDCLDQANLRLNGTLIVNLDRRGASASRNIGAGSVPKYRRGKYVCFLDDDVYMMPGWDRELLDVAEFMEGPDSKNQKIISGHAHPFNHGIACGSYSMPLVISTVNMFMSWSLWDDVGWFVEPGGPGGSEDYDYCMRAKNKGYGFAVTEPHVVVHCGLTSSGGKRIVGYDEMMRQNERLVGKSGEKGVVYG